MYFPLLQNKQAEIRAIKELAEKNKLTNTIPIIHTPFNVQDIDWGNQSEINAYLKKKFEFIKTLISSNQKFILLFDNSLSYIGLTLSYAHELFLREFNIDKNTLNNLCSYGLFDSAINDMSILEDMSLAIFYKNKPQKNSINNIKYNILLNQNFVLEFVSMDFTNKIIITDSFVPQLTNKEYPRFDEFQTGAFTYSGHGLFGFGDYTVLNPNASKSGKANANNITVAIHVTFLNHEQDGIYVAHYLCEPSEEPSNRDRVPCALNKFKNDSDRFETTIGTSNLKGADRTSLVKLKEHTISHHIEFMNKY